MFARRLRLISIGGITAALIVGYVTVVLAGPVGWTASGTPGMQKTGDLPSNVFPTPNNKNCDTITMRLAGTTTMRENCVTQTTYGLVGPYGTVFTGTTEGMIVSAPWPYGDLHGVPNQGFAYTFTSPPTPGMHMHFYKSYLGNLKYEYTNNRWQYTKTHLPDFSLRNNQGQLYYIHSSNVAFSANGHWMVADAMDNGFIRVNMATFEVTGFAMSPNYSTLYGLRDADISISNDGRYAAIRPYDYSELKVYDIGACQSTQTPVKSPTQCASRDYWPDMAKAIPGFYRAYNPRFINDSQFSFKALYDMQVGVGYKVAQYTLTAPGENPSGIEYLGMGDSFASGQGAFNYMVGTDTANNTCHLSSRSYPFLLSASLFASGRSVACSGATTRDIIDPSLSYEGQVKDKIPKNLRQNEEEILLTYQPGYFVQNDFVQRHNPQAVTLSIGGNDVGFADIIKQCVMPSLMNSTCHPTYEDQQELKKRLLGMGDRLKTTYRTISSPGRRVYVIGYPQIVISGGNCANNVHLNEQEIKLFIELTDTFNRVIKKAAENAGAQYVDVTNALAGHRMCETRSSQVAVNGFTTGNDDGLGRFKFVGAESYHPNALGHELLERAIRGQTNNMKAPTPMPSTTPLVTSDIPSALPYPEAVKTGRTMYETISAAALAPDIVAPAEILNLRADSSTVLLKPSSTVTARLDDAPATLATTAADPAGSMSLDLTLPPTTPCGTHTLHVYGTNIANQPVDIFKVIYVVPTGENCGSDITSVCGPVAPSGMDIDKDGIDDACDPLIDEPPTYSVTLTGSSIHVYRPE